MGILSTILGADNPIAQWTVQNRNLLNQWGAGIGSGVDLGQGFANAARMGPEGAKADAAYAASQEAEAKRQEQLNATTQYLQAKFPDLASAVTAGMPLDSAWNEAMKRSQPGYGQVDVAQMPASIQEWNAYNALPPEQKAEYLRMKRATPYLDVGTGFVSPDPLNPGATSGPEIVKDNFTPKYDEALGTGTGKADVETKTAFDSLNSKLPGLKSVVGELGDLAEKATYTTAGRLWDDVVRESGAMPTEGALARTKYMSMVDNQVLPLLRDTFGAAFTVQEGESLRATLGAPDKSPAEKKAVLEAFIEQKVRDLEALQRRLPGASAPAAGAAPTNYKSKYGLE